MGFRKNQLISEAQAQDGVWRRGGERAESGEGEELEVSEM